MSTWEEIAQDHEFQELPLEKKRQVADGWWKDTTDDEEFRSLPAEKQAQAYNNFLSSNKLTGPRRPMSPAEKMIWDRATLPQRMLAQSEMMNLAPRDDEIEAQRERDVQGLIEAGHGTLTDEQVAKAQQRAETPWFELPSKWVKNVPGELVKDMSGVAKSYSEMDFGGGPTALGRALSRNKIPEKAKEFAEDYMIDEAVTRPGTFKHLVNMAGSSVAQNLPWMVAGFMIGGPAGAALPLTEMYLQSHGQRYNELSEAGVPMEKRLPGAMVEGMAEVLGEALPTVKLLKRGVPIMRKVFNVMAPDITGEEVTYVLQKMNEKHLLKPDMTWREFAQGAFETLVVSGMASPAQTGMIGLAENVGNRLTERAFAKSMREYERGEAVSRSLPPKFDWNVLEQAASPETPGVPPAPDTPTGPEVVPPQPSPSGEAPVSEREAVPEAPSAPETDDLEKAGIPVAVEAPTPETPAGEPVEQVEEAKEPWQMNKDELKAETAKIGQKTSEDIQSAIDDKLDSLADGIPDLNDRFKHPEVASLMRQREIVDNLQLMKAYDNIKDRISDLVPEEDVDYILKNIYYLAPGTPSGIYMASQHTQNVVADRRSAGEKIIRHLVEAYGRNNNLDMDGLLNPNISGWTPDEINKFKRGLTEQASKITDAIETYFGRDEETKSLPQKAEEVVRKTPVGLGLFRSDQIPEMRYQIEKHIDTSHRALDEEGGVGGAESRLYYPEGRDEQLGLFDGGYDNRPAGFDRAESDAGPGGGLQLPDTQGPAEGVEGGVRTGPTGAGRETKEQAESPVEQPADVASEEESKRPDVYLPNSIHGGYTVKKGTYIRFGRPPEKGMSKNNLTGEVEPGISVYTAWYDLKTKKYVIATDAEIGTLDSFMSGGRKKIYEVSGEFAEAEGYDGEPLLRNVRILKEIHPDEVVSASDPWLTATGKELSDDETPSWEDEVAVKSEAEEAAEAAAGQDPPGDGEYASTDDYAPGEESGEYAAYTPQDALVSLIDLPEMVQLTEMLGNLPIIRARIRQAAGSATIGVFNVGKHQIILSPDAFRDSLLARQVLAHEIGHWIDALSIHGYAKTLKSNSILVHLSGIPGFLKEAIARWPGAPGELTNVDRAKLRREAAKQAKAGQKTTKSAITEEDIVAIWNNVGKANPELERYIAELSGPQKAEIARAAMRGGPLPEWFDFKVADDNPDIAKIYADLVIIEMAKRGLFRKDEIMAELKALSKKWRPYDDTSTDPRSVRYKKYRQRPSELYADAVSVLFNRPNMLATEAPKTFEMWHNYLRNHPEAQKAYAELQKLIAKGEEYLQDYRYNREMAADKEGNRSVNKALQRVNEFDYGGALARALLTERHNWLKLGKKVKGEHPGLPETEDIRLITEALPFSDCYIHLYYLDVAGQVIRPLMDAGYDVSDLNIFAKHMSNAFESARKASPGGFTWEASLKFMEHLKKEWGPERYGKVQEAYFTFQQLRQQDIMPRVQDSEYLDPKLLVLLMSNRKYSRRLLTKHMVNKYGDSNLGTVFTGRVYKRMGSFGQTAPAFTATLIQDVALLHAAHVNKIKRQSVEWLLKYANDKEIVRPAEYERLNGRPTEKLRESPYKGFKLVKYMHLGKVKGAYLHYSLADYMNRSPEDFGENIRAMRHIWSKVSNPIKTLMTARSLGWNIWNIQRDFRETVMKLPGATAFRMAPLYKKAWKEAFQEIWKGKVSDNLREMYAEQSIVPQSAWEANAVEDQQYILSVMEEIGQGYKQPGSIRPGQLPAKSAKFLWDTLLKIGQTGERASKIAGHMYMKKYFPAMGPLQRSHLVRTRAGSPNPYERGTLNFVTNEVFPFSTMGKEGYRSHFLAFQESPWEYTWKFIKWNLLWNIGKWMGMAGMLDWLIEELSDLFLAIPDRDKANYSEVPVHRTDDGKVVYFLWPHDFTAQALLAVVTMAALPGNTLFSTVRYAFGGLPYTGFHPILNAVWIAINTAQGKTWTDPWSGQDAVSKQAMKAGGTVLAKEMAQAVWNQLFSSLYRFNSRTEKELTNEIERVLKYPIIGPIASRIIRVSDQGITDERRRRLVAPHEQRKAQEETVIYSAIDDFLKDHPYRFNTFNDSLENKAARAASDSLYRRMKDAGMIEMKTEEGFWASFKEHSINMFGSSAAKQVHRADKVLKGKLKDDMYYRQPERWKKESQR